jgi:hypothetical protein
MRIINSEDDGSFNETDEQAEEEVNPANEPVKK